MANEGVDAADLTASLERLSHAPAAPSEPTYHDSTYPVTFTAFFRENFDDASGPKFFQWTVQAPKSFRKCIRELMEANEVGAGLKDREKFMHYMREPYAPDILRQHPGECIICSRPATKLFGFFCALYNVSLTGNRSEFIPTSHVVRGCEDRKCSETVYRARSPGLLWRHQNLIWEDFKNYQKTIDNGQQIGTIVYEFIYENAGAGLHWCGTCKETWIGWRYEQPERLEGHLRKCRKKQAEQARQARREARKAWMLKWWKSVFQRQTVTPAPASAHNVGGSTSETEGHANDSGSMEDINSPSLWNRLRSWRNPVLDKMPFSI